MRKFVDGMRRYLSAALVIVLLIGAMSMEVFAAEEEPVPPAVEEDGEALPAPEEEQTEPSPLPEDTLPPVPTQAPTPEPTQVPTPAPTQAPKPAPTQEPAIPPTEPEVVALPEPVPAESGAEPIIGETESDDPLYWKMNEPMTIAAIPSSFSAVTPRSLNSGETLRKGVDVSEFQGNITWSKVKAAGIEFAIIRVAYRGARYGTLDTDANYVQNLKNAKAAGVKVGAYFLSQAITPEEAREEARYLVNIVKNYSIDLPLVFDYEEVPSVASRRLVMSKLSRQLKTDIANAFCDEVEKSGYRGMVYTNLSMLNTDLYPAQLGRVWLAHWTKKSTYTGSYEYWQFGCGKVSGIPNEVDLDYWFDPGTALTPPLNGAVTSPSPSPTPTPAPSPTPGTGTQGGTAEFEDVKSSDWFYVDVQWAAGKGIVGGLGDGRFDPRGTATRAHVVTMIYRMKGQPKVSGTTTFTDLTGEYYRDAVTWAATNGIVKGTAKDTFSPNDLITRQDLVTLLYRMCGSPAASGSLSGFGDGSDVEGYAKDAMIWAVNRGLVKGYNDSTIRPYTSATRAEVCAILKRLSDLG